MSSIDTIQKLLDKAHAAAASVCRPVRVAFITSSYDTGFEPVPGQVDARVDQLLDIYGVAGSVHWSLWIVDDLPEERGFGESVGSTLRRRAALYKAGRLRCVPLSGAGRRAGGLKGRAVLDGMTLALAEDPGLDAVVYVNLNLKVDLRLSATGLAQVAAGRCDAAIGSRALRDGGLVVGAGRLGRLKSRAYSALARSALPPLKSFLDTNAPMKVFSRSAAEALVCTACIDQVTLDCEWLMIMHAQGFHMERFPVAWSQRSGSRPPWHLVPLSLRDIYRIRRRWRAGELDP